MRKIINSGEVKIADVATIMTRKNRDDIHAKVASTGIEPVSGASETLILSIVLRGLLVHRRRPLALLAKIFTAMASKTTPKNLRIARSPLGPINFSILLSDRNTI